jgi:hypothetical protein
MATQDIIGRRFGRLVAIEIDPLSPRGENLCIRWRCQCDCGQETVVLSAKLRNGHTKSCGCLFREALRRPKRKTHGDSGNPLYAVWRSMLARTRRQTHKDFPRYGGRGIAVCAAWKAYQSFRDWALSNGYAAGLSLDRIDNDGGYNPDNCRWATAKTQGRNRSNNRIVTYRGKTACLSEHAEDAGLSYLIVCQRLQVCGWSIERTLETPILSRSERAKAWRKRAAHV